MHISTTTGTGILAGPLKAHSHTTRIRQPPSRNLSMVLSSRLRFCVIFFPEILAGGGPFK